MGSGHGHGHDAGHHEEHAHAGPKLYWIFAVILCVITFFEWIIFKKKEEWGVSNQVLIWSLLAMSLIKFVMVCGWYMHLRFDNKMLTKIFVFSGLLAMGVFLIMKLSLPAMG
jgi:heme/copper-type cytochrome/quinol oxidase subunit 4